MSYGYHHYHHQSLNREGRWGTTDDFATSFLHFSLFSTALWDLPNSRPLHSLMLSQQIFLCLPCLLPPFTVPCKMVWPDLMNRRPDHGYSQPITGQPSKTDNRAQEWENIKHSCKNYWFGGPVEGDVHWSAGYSTGHEPVEHGPCYQRGSPCQYPAGHWAT